MGFLVRWFCVTLLLSSIARAQLPSAECDLEHTDLVNCPLLVYAQQRPQSPLQFRATASSDDRVAFLEPAKLPRKEGFHWGRALFESFTFLAIEQAYVVHDDYRWVVVEKGVPLNHFGRDYTQSLTTWIHSGWDDGDPALYSYLGHPLQGALTGYIQIQNDPQGRALEFANTRAYWWSRFKAFLWNAAYSTQWNIGPISELTVEKYGAQARPPWNKDGSWPCTRKPCVTGVGQVDLVTTPVGGFVWLLGEDLLDRGITRRLEESTRNPFLIDVTRVALNPMRSGANILHGKTPWYRASRDSRRVYWLKHAQAVYALPPAP